jgi:hypothetical protein
MDFLCCGCTFDKAWSTMRFGVLRECWRFERKFWLEFNYPGCPAIGRFAALSSIV